MPCHRRGRGSSETRTHRAEAERQRGIGAAAPAPHRRAIRLCHDMPTLDTGAGGAAGEGGVTHAPNVPGPGVDPLRDVPGEPVAAGVAARFRERKTGNRARHSGDGSQGNRGGRRPEGGRRSARRWLNGKSRHAVQDQDTPTGGAPPTRPRSTKQAKRGTLRQNACRHGERGTAMLKEG